MKYRPYPHEALKKAFASALSPAHLDLAGMMTQKIIEDDEDTPPAFQGSRLALVAALGMGIRKGIFSKQEVQRLQRRAAIGDGPAIEALRAMQAENPKLREKELGVLLWRIKYGGEQGTEIFMACAHLLAEMLRRRSRGLGKLSVRYVAVMQCALTEWLHDRCQPCKGTGSVGREKAKAGRNHPALYTCTSCGGTGAYEPGSQQRARALRMDVEDFVKKWESKYEGVLNTLQRVDKLTGKAIARQTKGQYATATDRSYEQE